MLDKIEIIKTVLGINRTCTAWLVASILRAVAVGTVSAYLIVWAVRGMAGG